MHTEPRDGVAAAAAGCERKRDRDRDRALERGVRRMRLGAVDVPGLPTARGGRGRGRQRGRRRGSGRKMCMPVSVPMVPGGPGVRSLEMRVRVRVRVWVRVEGRRLCGRGVVRRACTRTRHGRHELVGGAAETRLRSCSSNGRRDTEGPRYLHWHGQLRMRRARARACLRIHRHRGRPRPRDLGLV